MEMADAMVYGGYKAAGYQYVCIDVRIPLLTVTMVTKKIKLGLDHSAWSSTRNFLLLFLAIYSNNSIQRPKE